MKSQAAVEFLITYGWAFMLMLAAIAGLFYFGVVDVSQFVPNSCKLDGVIECGDSMTMYYDNSADKHVLELDVINNLPEDIVLTDVKIKSQDNDVYCKGPLLTTPGIYNDDGEKIIDSFDSREIAFIFTETADFEDCGLTDGVDDKTRYDVMLIYKRGDLTVPNVATGKIVVFQDERELIIP